VPEEAVMSDSERVSRAGMWDEWYRRKGKRNHRKWYGEKISMTLAASFLSVPEVITVEDWGCGFGGFSELLGPHQRYVGVDGSKSPAASVYADLTQYTSSPDGLLLRHVLEHNPDWESILDNALVSFQKRMVLIVFTPFRNQTAVIHRYKWWHGCKDHMIDIGFRKEDLTDRFGDLSWTEEQIKTRSQYNFEHLFYLEK
jgi:hypothetical protein